MVSGIKLREFNRDKFHGIVWRKRKRLARWRQFHRRHKGLPTGLNFETVNQLCIEHLGKPLKRVSYIHLSRWKVSGSYRLFLESVNGQAWQLIYRNEIYNEVEIPALNGFPLSPGPPEYSIYNNAEGELRQYLPNVYVCREIIPGRHYQYILEDLSQEYQVLKIDIEESSLRKKNLLLAINEIPKLHLALGKWAKGISSSYLIDFNRQFSTSLLVYAQKNLESYFRATGDPVVSDLNKRWSVITELVNNNEFHDQLNDETIHGDYHFGHIYVHKNDCGQVKLIDWEWVGSGLPHFDLATILQGQDPEYEQFALAHYAKQDKRLSHAEHVRLFEWCHLERGLLNASYLASQHISSSRKGIGVPEFIQKSISRALRAQDNLCKRDQQLTI